MLRTPLCDLFGIEHPIIQAAIAPFTAPELVAAVSNAGGLGSYATAVRPADDVRRELARVRELTDRPFAVNFTLATFDQEAWAHALAARPAVISFALGDPGDLVAQAHAVGSLVVQQVHTVAQAENALTRGVDAIIAQGTEAGGIHEILPAAAIVRRLAAEAEEALGRAPMVRASTTMA